MNLRRKLALAALFLSCAAACTKPPSAPPPAAATAPSTSAPTATAPTAPTTEVEADNGLPPGILFGPRRGGPPDGCFVSIYPDPKAPIAPAIEPRPTKVSCTAPIEPPPPGDRWCRVARADDPSKKTRVKCEP